MLFVSCNLCAKTKKEDGLKDLHIDIHAANCISNMLPRTAELINAAIRSSSIDTKESYRWRKGIKYAALLPRLQLDYERKVKNTLDLNIKDSISLSSAGVTIGPSANDWANGYNNDNNFSVKAIWYLDELLFNRDSLAASSEARELEMSRQDLIEKVSSYYAELKGAISAYISRQNSKEKGWLRTEIDRLVGILDAATEGWFSNIFDLKSLEERCEQK